jgi:hypothetical protein
MKFRYIVLCVLSCVGIMLGPMAGRSATSAASSGRHVVNKNWHVVKKKSIEGEFAGTSMQATAHNPRALAIRLKGAISNGNAVVRCKRRATTNAYSRSYSHAGLYRLLILPKHASSCRVTVGMVVVGGRGTVLVLKR